jgi:hypothetical protein
VVPQIREAIIAAIAGDDDKAIAALKRAGFMAVKSVIVRMESNIPPPLKPSTIRNRKYARDTASRREDEIAYLDLTSKGIHPQLAQEQTGIIALINTGKLRGSITYVIRKK